MSPSLASVPPTAIDLQLLHDNNIDHSKQSTTPADGGLLSPYSVYQPYSTSDSPSSFTSPADVTSNGDYSDFTDFNNPDQYFGVDFDAGEDVVDADSSMLHNLALPTTELPIEAYLPHPHSEATRSTETLSNTTYTMSPNHSTTSNTSHLINQSYDTHTAAQPLYGGQSQDTSTILSHPYASNSLQPLSLTRGDYTGSEEDSTQSMANLTQSPRFTVTTWGSQVQQEIGSEHQKGQFGELISSNYEDLQDQGSPGHRVVDSSNLEPSNSQQSVYAQPEDLPHPLDTEQASGRSGLDPDGRKYIENEEIPSLKEQKEKDQLEATKLMVEEWRSHKSESSDSDEGPELPRSNLSAPAITRQRAHSTGAVPLRDPHMMLPRTSTKDPEEGKGILPVSDNESIHENRLQEGQTYYNLKYGSITDADRDIAMNSRHWSDTPMYPHAVSTQYQAQTAKDAMKRWNDMADNYSLISRTATWGTRRRSEPTATDMESITDGSLFQRIAVTNDKEKRPGPGGYFKDSIEHLSSIVRKRSDGSKLKRNRSDRENQNRGRLDAPRKESQTSLAPPPRSPSNRRPASPRLDTTVGGLQGHIKNGSVSASNAISPKNPLTSLLRGSIRRSRSKSDNQVLVKMWSESGGPPVPTLAQQSHLSDPAPEPDFIKLENSDLDAEDDEDEELGDEIEKMEFDQSAVPISPSFVGFQEHVRRLNPKMEAGYLVDRVAHQQVVRYKCLLGWRVKHHKDALSRTCSSGAQCMRQGGTATIFGSNGRARDSSHSNNGLGLDFSDGDSNPEGALVPENFPSGVPMPPASTLPAEFECQLCFRVKAFNKPSDWTKHVHEDVQPFTCTYASCKEPKSFKRKADWVRHENERHRHLEWWTCQVDDCTHKCYRKDNFLQHLVREHKLPEPKVKTKAAVKKSRGGPDEQVWIMVQQCHHETTNKPQDEPCKFCGRTLTSWKKLTVHLAKHMEHISLPVLELVKNQSVDANTIISPVEPLPARQTPLPVTPTDARRLSNTSAVLFANISATISPSGHTIGHFTSPFDQTPKLQGLPQFLNAGYRDDMVFNQTSSNHGAPFTSSSQSHHGLTYESTSVCFNPFDQTATNPNLNPHARGYSSMNHSPHIDQNHGFNPINPQNYTNPVQQGYHSHPSSHHTHSPDPTSFVSGPQHMPGFQAETVGPDMSYTSRSHQIPGYTIHQNQIMDMTDAQFNSYQPINNNPDYSQMLESGNQGAYEQQMGRGQGRQTYPPSSHGGYGGYGQ